MSTEIKTLNGWTDFADRTGRTGIYDYLRKGDIVEENLVDYFMNVMPPRAMSYGCLQVGEPHSHYRTIVISGVIFHSSSDVCLIDIWISAVSRYNRHKKSHCSCSHFMPDRVDSRLQQSAMPLKDIQSQHLYM